MKILFAVIALAAASSGGKTVRHELACPDYVQTRQELVSAHEGWEVGPSVLEVDDGVLRHPGSASGFSEGPGQQAAFLVPGEDGWSVPDEGDIWLNCTYYGTKIILSKRVPRGAVFCGIDEHPQTKHRTAWCDVRT